MIALDTNILIYAYDGAERKRQQTAIDLISTARDAVLLWQVACEFIAASRKLHGQGFTTADAWNRLSELLGLFPLVTPGAEVLDRARQLHLGHQVSFWDATILAACQDANVSTLYSEDIPGLANLDPLRVVNPFG
jgi:predicted nucleic acid-binding protein